MTTHLEEVLGKLKKYCQKYFGEQIMYHEKNILNQLINFHIKYLESETNRLELLEKGLFGDDLELIIDERIRKQQELLQAKELLK
jgi:hypothetical protein